MGGKVGPYAQLPVVITVKVGWPDGKINVLDCAHLNVIEHL